MTGNTTVRRGILLAAGRGTRLGALTLDRPKPMVLLRGKPVLEHILLGLQQAGVSAFLLVVGYRAEFIQNYFEDGARWGFRIEYVLQDPPTGTGAALALGRDFAESEPFVASFGDILTERRHYRELISEYAVAPCAAVLGINPVDDPSAGSAVTREGNRVIEVVEKPAPGTARSHWNLAGFSVYSPAIWPLLAALRLSPRGEYELTDAISGLIATGEEVRAYEASGFWSDIGTPEALAEAKQGWASAD